MTDTDVIIVGAGLSGLVAARELCRAGHTVTIVEQEGPQNLGGQAWWSFGGLFLVDSPEQRRLGVRDSAELAWNDWRGSAGWDRVDGPLAHDRWAVPWAEAYVGFAAGEKRSWLRELGVKLTPLVGWAERGDLTAAGHGNSVPRFHVPWGTGTGVVRPFAEAATAAQAEGRLVIKFRHRVEELLTENGVVTGVRGRALAPDEAPRGAASTREAVGEFTLRAQAVIVASGGIGGDHERVRRQWPERLGTPPREMITGVPAYVDGRMLDSARGAGARLVNEDRMWHYTEGVRNWSPIWPGHGIRILPGPSPLWLDALGRRLPPPNLPGHDTLSTLQLLRTDPLLAGHDHSWFVVSQQILAKEFALSGSEQNPDLTDRDWRLLVRTRLGRGAPQPVRAFVEQGADFVTASSVGELADRMSRLTLDARIDAASLGAVIRERDGQLVNAFAKDAQALSIANSRRYRADRLARTARPHRLADKGAGPLVAVRLNVLTRKSLGGIQTDLQGRALDEQMQPIPGLYAVGEAAGFGGGGIHGYRALEGTFLGGCLFTGRVVGRAVAAQL